MDHLDFDFHLNRYKGLFVVENKETKKGAMTRALEDHQLAVRGELMNFTSHVVMAGHKLANKKAQQYMWYGVGRRLRMILVSYREIFDTVAADRQEPLPIVEMAAVSRDLNIIYINIRGVLDNYAWCLCLEKEMRKTTNLKNNQIGLFYEKFRNHKHLMKLKPLLASHLAWNTDLNTRRDPSAHRMPLYVPTSVLSDAETERFQQIWKDREEAIRSNNIERDIELCIEQSKLGKFRPTFHHDPDDEGFRIYPNDVGRLIAIGTKINGELLEVPDRQ
jgi:hypothetical protein